MDSLAEFVLHDGDLGFPIIDGSSESLHLVVLELNLSLETLYRLHVFFSVEFLLTDNSVEILESMLSITASLLFGAAVVLELSDLDVAGLRESLEEFEAQALSAEDKVKRHADMCAKLQSDLAREADGRAQLERTNAKLSHDIFQLNARIEEVEGAARAAAKNKISQLEIKIRQLENDCSSEQKARSDAQHALKNLDRVIREKEFNAEEDMKTVQRLQGQIEFQNNKMKALRRTIDDGEAQIAVMQNKLRKAIHDVEEAEERAAMLETQLVRGGRGGGGSSSSHTTRITTRRVAIDVKREETE
jgi:myosin protein heavy chain